MTDNSGLSAAENGMTNGIEQAFSSPHGPLPVIATVMTPYHLMFFERVWRAISPRPLLLIDHRPARNRAIRKPNFPGMLHHLELDLTGKVNSAEQARLVREAMSAAELFASGQPVLFACPTYQAPVNNAIYTRHRRDPAWHFALFEEGLSSYLTLKAPFKETVRNILREVVARLRGFPQRTLYGGHTQGVDLPELRAIVLGTDPSPSGPATKRYVTLPHNAEASGLSFNSEHVLFVGQPYVSAYGYDPEFIRNFAGAIRSDLHKRGFKRVAFKAHHFQSPEDVAIYVDQGFEPIESLLPVEEMIATSEFRTIASVNTTALLTARSLFGDAIHSIAYNPADLAPHYESRDMNEVERIFRQGGVEIVKLPL